PELQARKSPHRQRGGGLIILDRLLVRRGWRIGARRGVRRILGGHAAVGVARLLLDAVGLGVQGALFGFIRRGGGLSFQGVGLLFRSPVGGAFAAGGQAGEGGDGDGGQNEFTHGVPPKVEARVTPRPHIRFTPL